MWSGRPWPRLGGPLQQAALLVFLPGPARARVVATHLLSIRGTELVAGSGRPRDRPVLPTPGLLPVGRALSYACGGRLLLAHAHLEELLDVGLLQAPDHLLEHVEGFLLVLGQRIA